MSSVFFSFLFPGFNYCYCYFVDIWALKAVLLLVNDGMIKGALAILTLWADLDQFHTKVMKKDLCITHVRTQPFDHIQTITAPCASSKATSIM